MDAQHAEDADAGGDAQIEMPARSRFMVFEREADRAAYDAWLRPPAQCHATRKATLQLACAIEVLLIMCGSWGFLLWGEWEVPGRLPAATY